MVDTPSSATDDPPAARSHNGWASREFWTGWRWLVLAVLAIAGISTIPAAAEPGANSLRPVFQGSELVILADVKHGVRDRVVFLSSTGLFEEMKGAGVRHVAIEMPRVLGRQAMGIETEADIAAFAQDVILAGRWHFVDPDHPHEESPETQLLVLTALGRQVLFAKRLGLNPIFYDFNNPLGGFRSYNDPVYRCLAELSSGTWLRYGLDGKVTKAQRDAAIMRERFSHDDELAAFIESAVRANGGGKVVVVPGYAHAVIPGGLAERMETRLGVRATIVALMKDEAEGRAFHTFLWQQARMLSIDLSRPPHYYYTIADGGLRADDTPGRYVALDGSQERDIPHVCQQIAQLREASERHDAPLSSVAADGAGVLLKAAHP